MDFILDEFHQNISDEEILSDIITTTTVLGKETITMHDYDKYGKYNSSTVIKHFGTWNNALVKLELPINQRFWNKQDLFINLETAWIKKGKQPSRRDMDNKELSYISSGAYLRAFGKWSTALAVFIEFINNTSESVYVSAHNAPQNDKKHNTTRDANLRLRFLVMKRDNFKCCMCGRSPATTPGLELHIDHIVPWSKGGETVIDNLQTLCSDCNLGKSNLSETE